MSKRYRRPLAAILAFIMCVTVLVVPGCAKYTIQKPDGTVETTVRVDLEQTIALTNLALQSAEQGLYLYSMYCKAQDTRDIEAEKAEQARLETRITFLRNQLETLMALAASVPKKE